MNLMAAIVTQAKDVHWGVRVAMKRMGYPEIGDKLETLASFRHKSDYEMGTTVTKDDWDASCTLADDVLNLIRGVS